MKFKTLLIDLDGVVLHRSAYFSERVKKLYPDANHEAIKEFFINGLYSSVTRGEVSLEAVLEEVLPEWNVNVSVEHLLKDWFGGENNIDQLVLERIQDIRSLGVRCVVVTDHSEYRKNDVWEGLGLKNYFDGIISSCDIGVTKDKELFFQKTLESLSISEPSTVAFTDDDPKNVESAKSVGVAGFVFENIDSLNNLD